MEGVEIEGEIDYERPLPNATKPPREQKTAGRRTKVCEEGKGHSHLLDDAPFSYG
jgi:hypothetical protein